MFNSTEPLWETIIYVAVTICVGGYYAPKLIKYLFNGMGWNKAKNKE